MDPTAALAAQDLPIPDTRDFEQVVRLHWPRVYRFILASVRDTDEAQTLAQDCFLRAHRGWSRFRGECPVHAWLMSIAVNLIRDFARSRRLQFWKRSRQTSLEITDAAEWLTGPEVSAEERVLQAEQIRGIWSASENLPERQRTVLLLRFVEDMDLLEIAAVTGMTEGTVKTHLFRALRSIRAQIGKPK